MQLWPIVLWPKPRARQQQTHIHLQFATSSSKNKLRQIFIINVLLLITTTGTTMGVMVGGSTRQQSNYAEVDAVSPLTGLTKGYATHNYIKNYHQLAAEDSANNQQQQHQQQLYNEAGELMEQQQQHSDVRGDRVFNHGFMGLPSDNYENSIVARGQAAKVFNVHDTGLMPTTFTAAASLVGLQAVTDSNNAHTHTMATMISRPYTNAPSNNIDLEQYQQYGHDNVAVADNKVQQSMFGRLSNYGANVYNVDGGQAEDVGLQNYALAYADDAQQQSTAAAQREQFYNEHNNHNGGEQQHNFANYFSKTTAVLPPTYEIGNQQKYYTLNNYHQTEPHQQQYQQHEEEEEPQNNLYNRPAFEEQTYKLQALITTPAPGTFYQTYIKQNKNDNNNRQQHPQQHAIMLSNYQLEALKQHQQQQNQISGNYHIKQLAKQQQQYNRERLEQEPEMAETSHVRHFKKYHKTKNENKNKSKRSNNDEETYDLPDSDESAHIELEQLQQLQNQLQQQQQQFVNLQHQLIDHDQQIQIQKHQVQQYQQPPILPPVTHSVHHNPYSLQALAGTPLAKHTQIIKSIPVHQHHRVFVPYKHNVSIEVPETIINTINKPTPIEIPVTKTIAVPDIQEVKIPIEKLLPFAVERPVPYIVEKRVPYAVEKQIAKPVYYNVPIKVPIVHTVVHKLHTPQHGHLQEHKGHDYYREPSHHRYRSHHNLVHTVPKRLSSHGHRPYYGHTRYSGKYLK